MTLYLSEFLAREGMGFGDCGPLAPPLPVAVSFIWMFYGCSGASLVLGEGKGHFITSLERVLDLQFAFKLNPWPSFSLCSVFRVRCCSQNQRLPLISSSGG